MGATCQDDVGDVAVIAVTELLRVLQAAPGEAHHGCLRVVEGGALVVKTGGANGVLDHVELLQLKKVQSCNPALRQHCVNISATAAYCLCILCHLVREGVGLPKRQLLIVEGVAEYAAHHRNVLEGEKPRDSEQNSREQLKHKNQPEDKSSRLESVRFSKNTRYAAVGLCRDQSRWGWGGDKQKRQTNKENN